jgi:hypothetical protein
VYIDGRKVVLGQAGVTNVSITKYPSINTFGYDAPTHWGWERKYNSFSLVGATTHVAITRSSSKWTLKLINNE